MGVKNENHDSSPNAAAGSPSRSGDGLHAEDACRYAIEPEVIFLHRQEAGESFVVAKHMARATYFRLGTEEYQVARLLNGIRSARDVVVASRNQGLEWSMVDVAEFIGSLVANGLAHVPEARTDDLMTSLAMSVSVLDEAALEKVVPDRADSQSAGFDNPLESAPNEPGRVEFCGVDKLGPPMTCQMLRQRQRRAVLLLSRENIQLTRRCQKICRRCHPSRKRQAMLRMVNPTRIGGTGP